MPPRKKKAIALEPPAQQEQDTKTNGEELPPHPRSPHELPTAPENCQVEGEGLSLCVVKKPATFTVVAHDTSGTRKSSGGDGFFIAIRGASRVRARVTDMRNGSYGCEWTPTNSGLYSIAVSLFGVSLPGSPFTVNVTLPYPYAPNCEARGDALSNVTARTSQSFEVLFRDRLGYVSQAVELDIFVQPFYEHEGGDDDSIALDLRDSYDAEAMDRIQGRSVPGSRTPSPTGSRAGAKGGKEAGEQEVAEPAAPERGLLLHDEGDGREEGDDERSRLQQYSRRSATSGGLTNRRRTINVQVGAKPLIVREGFEKDSPIVGQLIPGQLATVVEERVDESGNVRACVTIEEQLPTGFESARGELARSPRSRGLGAKLALRPLEEDEVLQELGPLPSGESMRPTPVASRGWVTLVKDGKKLVTSRVRLHAGQRQQHMAQWSRRLLNDKLQHEVASELESDPTGIGFAYGGMHPGVLHAKGALFEAHKVSFSVGLVGRYLLHVRLRQHALPLPGSPFTLNVAPGAPAASSTRLPKAHDGKPLRGTVGTGEDAGCELIVSTADKVGNICVQGGAAVLATCELEEIEVAVNDRGDGTYQVVWKSNKSGTFQSKISIGGENVKGSPVHIQLVSKTPELSKSDLFGPGLREAVAGKVNTFHICFVDLYGNHAIPGDEFQFGLAILKDKEKLTQAVPHPFEGHWVRPEEAKTDRKLNVEGEIYELTYVATAAGSCELHIWCDPKDSGERIAFPGSPFQIHVDPGEASPEVSNVDGWTKEARGVDKHGKVIQTDATKIIAGDNIFLRPQILDEFSNTAALPEGWLEVTLKTPDELTMPLTYTPSIRGGVTTYDVRCECLHRGPHEIDVTLNGRRVKGSPVLFEVLPSQAEPGMCKLIMPQEKVHPASTVATVRLETYDKFGNAGLTGGLPVAARLQLQKQGVHDQTMLMPNNHSLETVDNGDGTYLVQVSMIKIGAILKLIVNMDKNLPAAGGELPAVMLTFVKDESGQEAEVPAPAPSEPAPSDREAPTVNFSSETKETSKAKKQLKKGGQVMVARIKDEGASRKKDIKLMAADMFADGSDTFTFGAGVKTYVEAGDGFLTEQKAT